MWRFWAKITHFNQGRKLLQSFLDDAFPHRPPFVAYRNLELICVAVVCLSNIFLNIRLQAKIDGAQTWWVWGAKVFGPKAHVGVQPFLHILCRVCQRSVLLEDIIWLLSDLLNPWKNFFLLTLFNDCFTQ